MKNSTEMVAFTDSNCNGDCDPFVSPVMEVGRWGPGYRHNVGANVLFVDGHVQWYPIKDLVGWAYIEATTGKLIVSDGDVNGKRRMWNIDNKD